MVKKCSVCDTEKPHSEFNKKSKSADGLRPDCRSCQKQWYQKNKESILADMKKIC